MSLQHIHDFCHITVCRGPCNLQYPLVLQRDMAIYHRPKNQHINKPCSAGISNKTFQCDTTNLTSHTVGRSYGNQTMLTQHMALE